MKKVFFAHSTGYDYRPNIYQPIRSSDLSGICEITLPHEDGDELFDSKNFIQSDCDLVIAEVSDPSIGLGIELGWANMYDKPVVCIYKAGSKISSSVNMITDQVFEYKDADDMVEKIKQAVK